MYPLSNAFVSNSIPKLSVLLVAPEPFYMERGTPINVRAMASALGELGYVVDLLVYPMGEPVNMAGVNIKRSFKVPGISSVPIGPSWRKALLDVFLFFSAGRLVLTRRYSVVHGVEEGGFIAGFWATVRRVPFIYDMDSCIPGQLRDSGFVHSKLLLRLIERVELFCVSHARAVLTVCSALTDKIHRAAPQVLVYQIEDFPVESSMAVDDLLVQRFRSDWKAAKRKIAVYTGNFESYQGIDLLLKAFSVVHHALAQADDEKDYALVLVGGTASHIEKYQGLARSLGIEAAVVFTGALPGAFMGSVMAAADVLLSPRTEGENTPLKLYSYMAARKPIVATDIRSHTQVLDSNTAFLAAPTPEEFAGALTLALSDTPSHRLLQQSLVRNAHALIETKYNRAEFTRRLGELYKEVIGASPKQNCASPQTLESCSIANARIQR